MNQLDLMSACKAHTLSPLKGTGGALRTWSSIASARIGSNNISDNKHPVLVLPAEVLPFS